MSTTSDSHIHTCGPSCERPNCIAERARELRREWIDREADKFFEWPSDDHSLVRTVSAVLFAEQIAEQIENAAKYDAELAALAAAQLTERHGQQDQKLLLKWRERAKNARALLSKALIGNARYEIVRKMNVQDFKTLYFDALCGEATFDELVDGFGAASGIGGAA